MKKILFLIMIFTSIGLAQVFPVISDSCFFYADSISSTITLDRNEFISKIWLDADRSDKVYFQEYDAGKEKWSWLIYDDAKYTIDSPDSTLDVVVSLKPQAFYGTKQLRLLITNDPADTISVRYDKRPY